MALFERLYSLNRSRGIHLGLEIPKKLDSLLGYPSKQFRSIHVGGTNGKGSVTTMLAAAHQAAGYRTGLFTSPHLHTFRERICIDGLPISEEWTTRTLTQLLHLCDCHGLPATFFELTTALGFLAFAEMKVDLAVVEVGLGGRLDATNILTPELCILTSIGLDHCELLGHTIEAITYEKAGILKSKVPVIIGPTVPYQLMETLAAQSHCPLIPVQGSFNNYIEENQAIAKAAMEWLHLPKEAIVQGLLKRPRCRLERHTRKELQTYTARPLPEEIVLDVAHNPAGIQQLVKALDPFLNRRWRLVCGFSRDKELRSCIRTLLPHMHHIYPIAAPHPRSFPAPELARLWIEEGISSDRVSYAPTLEETLSLACSSAEQAGDSLLICGSFLIMTPVFQFLQLPCSPDPMSLT